MRIDKYLWCVRVYKTRTLATTQCKLNKVWVNGELIKASRELKPNDILIVRKGPIHFSWKVKAFPTSRLGAKFVPEYAEDITTADERAKLEIIKLQFQERPRGIGRPTKKDRRELDDFFENEDE